MNKPHGILIDDGWLRNCVEHATVPLDEAALSRIDKHWKENGFAAITSWRTERPLAVNKANLVKLKTKIKAAGYGWTQIIGRWTDSPDEPPTFEPSLIIPAIRRGRSAQDANELASDLSDLRRLVISWGKTYNQYSVVWSPPGGPAEHIATDPDVPPGGPPVGTVLARWSTVRYGHTDAKVLYRSILSRRAHQALKHRGRLAGRPSRDVPKAGKTFHLECFLHQRPRGPTEGRGRLGFGELVGANSILEN